MFILGKGFSKCDLHGKLFPYSFDKSNQYIYIYIYIYFLFNIFVLFSNRIADGGSLNVT